MNIYNFIYCYFYKFWEKRNNDGRIVASMHIFFTLLVHFFLLAEIIRGITGIKFNLMPRLGNYGESKTKYMLLCIPFLILIFMYYNRNRTTNLLKEYYLQYGNDGKKNTIKILIYIIVPAIIAVSLAIIRQRM